MDKHTFIGKRKVGSTDVCDFTDYQGIGRDPLYKRYESVYSILNKHIDPKYIHFIAAPDYSVSDDAVNWYIDEWVETPEILSKLKNSKKDKYQRIKDTTLNHYKHVLDNLYGEELQVMACVLRYIDDDFIFCCDDKVFVVAWGMTPDTRKHVSKGELVHESPSITKYKLTFDVGDHGVFSSKIGGHILLPEGAEISSNDIPNVVTSEGFSFKGWTPNPLGMKVTSDATFVAEYDEVIKPPAIPPVFSPETQEQQYATCSFNAGNDGIIEGKSVITKPIGSRLSLSEVPTVTPKKGFTFKGWDVNPLASLIKGDISFNALYEKNIPWYKKIWLWLTGRGCLKWLLWALLALILLLLISWLFKGCHSCSRSVNGVDESAKIVTAAGDTIDDNGEVRPISLHNGKLPDETSIVAPVRGEDGDLPPIIREPGVPPVIANRLFLFLENDNDNVDALAEDFKKVYPQDKYRIIGFDRDVKSLLIEIPESERDEIRRTINSKLPNHKFIVFDEEIYELNGHLSGSSVSSPGWHLNAVKAREGWQITKGSSNVTVAIVDDGIDASHPMFDGRIVNAYNVYTQNNKLSNGGGHGTHTAGLAVGSLEFLNQGAAGIAPDCMLMPIQVIDNNICPLSALVSGVMYAVHKGADVVNISIGPSFQGLNQLPVELQSQIAQTQFKNAEKLWNRVCKIAANKNTVLVFAAGNDDILSSIPPENRSAVAITVGAVDQKLYPTDFTNYGPCTDISAPGKEIYSSFPTKNFRSFDGTSMAAPIVSGTVALMKSLKKDLSVEQARNVLYRTGSDVFGNMPPMVQVNLALDAVKKGDFSAPTARQMPPVPDLDMPTAAGDTPASWISPASDVIAVGTDKSILIEKPIQTNSPVTTVTPVTNNGSDYDAIRRMIAIYKQKITELEGQLPENKK
ncbi:MAG: S8 family serine peptidase [Bacteroides sp.]|nr:S8 family serine peptidase [Bacteroides sp.]